MKTAFVITIDTEGDNLWSVSKTVTTENAGFLPRFQALCDRYGFKPTYLVNYEMAIDPRFQKFGRDVVERDSGEIGLHLHAWNSPPIDTAYDGGPHYYQNELPDSTLFAKLVSLTTVLEEVFEVRPVSHRAGRWGFDARVARALVELGYLVDCSVAPGANFRRHKGFPDGLGGPDFHGFPVTPYLLDPVDIQRSGNMPLLEVPVTIKPNYGPLSDRLHHRVDGSLPSKVMRVLRGPAYSWLRPNGCNLPAMIDVVEWGIARQFPVLEFMLHSSELMPGGSPKFTNNAQIETLYQHLEKLFTHLASREVVGMTLAEYRAAWST